MNKAERDRVNFRDKWGVPKRKLVRTNPAFVLNPRIAEMREIPSLDTGVTGAISSKPSPEYTGTKIVGIGVMHKSNAVPIFSEEEAVDISKMRR